MKKILALTLSLLMIFALIPLTLTASATSDTVTLFTMDVGSRSSYASVTARANNLTYVDSGEDGYGYVMQIDRKSNGGIQDQSIFLQMPANLYTGYGNITSISFDAKTDSGNFFANPFSLTADPNNAQASNISNYVLSFTNGNKSATFGTTWTTYTIDMTTANAKSAIKRGDLILNIRNTWSSSNTCNYVYLDNFKFTYDYFNATFTGTTDVDGQVEVDENRQVTLPTGTLASGELCCWVTEDDYLTTIPAGTTVTLTKDTTFIAVSPERTTPEAPEAPVVESKTANSVTLVANENYQYSKDGTTWQDSNVFSGLTPATTYTFYQRLKATSTEYASPASAGTTAETLAVYTFEAENVYTSDYTGALNANSSNSDTSTGSLVYVVHDASNPAVGHYVTYKFTGISTGYYSISLFSRNVSGSRSTYDVTAYDEKGTEQSAGSINFGDLSTKVGSNQYYCNPSLTENVYVKSGSELTLKLTISKIGSSSGSYIDKFVLTKVAEVEKDGLTTDAVLTDDKASIRLTDEGGIRFYTTFDESKVTGTVEEIGTLIGPADLIGDYLTIDDTNVGNAVAVPYLASTLWENDQFVGSIAKIKETNYARDFVARGYVKVDGVYYYSTASATRNVRFVADAYIADPNGGYADLDDETKAIVDKFATPKA